MKQGILKYNSELPLDPIRIIFDDGSEVVFCEHETIEVFTDVKP